MLSRLGREWLARWHGAGATNQYQFYRCKDCKRLVTWNMIRANGGRHGECTTIQVRPTYPRLLERVRLLCLPWTMHA